MFDNYKQYEQLLCQISKQTTQSDGLLGPDCANAAWEVFIVILLVKIFTYVVPRVFIIK